MDFKVIANSIAVVPVTVTITDQDIMEFMNSVGSTRGRLMSSSSDEDTLETIREVVGWMFQAGRAKISNFDRQSADIQIDPEQVGKIKNMYIATESSLKLEAAGQTNPAQRQANEALKLAKSLSDVLNTLAGMGDRENLTRVSGLQELSSAIDRLYEYSDQLRMGQIQQVGMPAYAGWNPDRLIAQGVDMVDTKSIPRQVVKDPSEQFMCEKNQTGSPSQINAEIPLEK